MSHGAAVTQLVLWVLFFLAQVYIKTEVPLTLIAVLLCGTLVFGAVKGERYLFALGVGMALIIEIGLGLIARTQVWSHASLFGVPYWLPLMWGYGFVVMRRIGNYVVDRVG
jgi:hypothetical protein